MPLNIALPLCNNSNRSNYLQPIHAIPPPGPGACPTIAVVVNLTLANAVLNTAQARPRHSSCASTTQNAINRGTANVEFACYLPALAGVRADRQALSELRLAANAKLRRSGPANEKGPPRAP